MPVLSSLFFVFFLFLICSSIFFLPRTIQICDPHDINYDIYAYHSPSQPVVILFSGRGLRPLEPPPLARRLRALDPHLGAAGPVAQNGAGARGGGRPEVGPARVGGDRAEEGQEAARGGAAPHGGARP